MFPEDPKTADPNAPRPPEDGQDTLQEVLGGFPRHLTTQLIEEGEERRSHREVLGGLVLGLALAAFALAFPQLRLIGQQVEHMDPADPLVPFVIDVLRRITVVHLGMMPEQIGFVIAALAYGACLPVGLGVARRQGLGFGLALVGTLAVLLSPVAWVAGTTPGPEALALLFLFLALDALWGGEGARPLMAACYWVFAAACQPALVWLLPAVVVAGLRGQEKRFELGFSLPLIGGVLFLIFAMPLGVTLEWSELADRVSRSVRFGGSGGWFEAGVWLVGLLPGLGLSLVALASLFFLKRDASEERPPRWLALWCGLPLLALTLSGSPTWSIPYLWLLPPALIGACDLLARRAEGFALGSSALVLSGQATAIFGVSLVLGSTDPQASWRDQARTVLQEEDLVVTADAGHAYLIASRWGLTCLLLQDPGIPGAKIGHVLLSPEGESPRSSDHQQSLRHLPWEAGAPHADDSMSTRVVLDRGFPAGLAEHEREIADGLATNSGLIEIKVTEAQ